MIKEFTKKFNNHINDKIIKKCADILKQWEKRLEAEITSWQIQNPDLEIEEIKLFEKFEKFEGIKETLEGGMVYIYEPYERIEIIAKVRG